MSEKQSQHDFISTVSHELRTPLTSIRGFAQTMLSSWDMLDNDSKKQFLKIIEEQSNRLIKLVENVLAVSKVQSKENYVYKSVSANSSIKAVIPIVQQQYKTHKIVTEFNEKLPPIVVDNNNFQQIIINLVENACKYSKQGSEVRIKTDFAPNNFVSIKIIDHGVGIKDDDKERIFEKFSRIDNPLTRKTQGSGLGLFITKSLTEKMNGQISFKNMEKGTEFEIKFPQYNIEDHIKCSVTH